MASKVKQEASIPFNSQGVYTPVSGATTAIPGAVIMSSVWNNMNVDQATAFSFLGGQELDSTPVNHAASPYTPLATDTLLLVDSTAGGVTISMPLSSARTGKLRIKDSGGMAATNSIAINRSGSDTFQGATTLAINNNYGGFEFFPITGGWEIMGGTAAAKEVMTTAQYLNDTTGKILSTDRVWAAAVSVALTDAATVTMDFSTFINANLTGTVGVGTSRTLASPTNAKVGQSGVIEWFPVTGALTLLIPTGDSYIAAGGINSLVLSKTNGARDAIVYSVLNDGKVLLAVQQGLGS